MSPKSEMKPYRFDHFRSSMLLKDMGFAKDSAAPGDLLPDLVVTLVDGEQSSLGKLAGERPLVLVTGSMTCPITAASTPQLLELERRFHGELTFAFVYVREAHPGANIPQATSLEQKLDYARRLRDLHGVDWPVVVDDLDGSLHRALDSKPNSVHVIAPDRRLLFRALFANDPRTEQALVAIAAGRDPKHRTGGAFMGPALRAVPQVHGVLVAAGKGAYADVARAAPPMALMGFASHLLRGSSSS